MAWRGHTICYMIQNATAVKNLLFWRRLAAYCDVNVEHTLFERFCLGFRVAFLADRKRFVALSSSTKKQKKLGLEFSTPKFSTHAAYCTHSGLREVKWLCTGILKAIQYPFRFKTNTGSRDANWLGTGIFQAT